LLLREGENVRVVLDRHVEGLFPAPVWTRLLERVGYRVGRFTRPLDDGQADQVFVCRRPRTG